MRFLLFIPILLILSCSSNNLNELKSDSKSVHEGAFDAEMQAIDADVSQSGQVAVSMRYTKDEEAFVLAKAHINQAGKIVKIEEEYNDGNNNNIGVNSFYYKDDKIFASRAYYSDMQSNPPTFVDQITYYDKLEKATKTIEKRVDFEENLDRTEYLEVKINPLSVARAKRVLDQKGEFETTFQGFIEMNPLRYIVIGAKNSAGYVSSIRVDYDDDFIKMLLKDQNKYLNKKIFINFENVVDPSGMQYQSYISGKLLE